MEDKQLLLIPGPTPVPESVRLAMARHPIGHRSKDFAPVIAEVTENLKWLHQTDSDVLMLAASGTGAMEAAIINFLSPGDRVLVGNNGKFGQRWGKVSRAFGLEVEEITAEWGKPLDPEAFRARLEADSQKAIKATIITHSETSTGVLNDLEAINRSVKDHGESSIVVDAVTSLGATDVPVDRWGLDVVASGSQKGYMLPPGLGFVCVSQKAWRAYETARLPRFYFDLGAYKKATDNDSSPFTPPVTLIYGLQVALQMMRREGLEKIWQRNKRLTRATPAGVRALGLPLLAADGAASPATTAVAPVAVAADALRATVSQRFDIALAGGQDHLKGKIFRIGHLGFVSERDVLAVLSALEVALQELGGEGWEPGAGVAAAARVLAG